MRRLRGKYNPFHVPRYGNETFGGNVAIEGNLSVAAGVLTLGSTAITESALSVVDGVTAGTAAASKAVVLGAQGNITGLGNITTSANGTLRTGNIVNYGNGVTIGNLPSSDPHVFGMLFKLGNAVCQSIG